MSSSNSPSKPLTGKVLLGGVLGGRADEVSLTQVEGSRRTSLWDEALEAEYLERVKVKATARAKEILRDAQREVDRLQTLGYQQGYADGIEKGTLEMEQERKDLADALGRSLAAVQQGARDIWDRHREDIVLLARLTIEKVLNIELAQRRQDILAAMLEQGLESLEEHRGLVMRLNPEDRETMEQLLETARQSHPGLEAWRIKPDPEITPGGLALEADYGMADNTLESRLAMVSEVLDNLSLPADDEEPAAQPAPAPETQHPGQDEPQGAGGEEPA